MGVPYEEVEVEVLLQRTQTVTVSHFVQVSHESEKERERIAIDMVRAAWEAITPEMWEQHPPEIQRMWEMSGTPRVIGVDV